MDRRSFLKSMAALGLIPAVDIERLLQEAYEPAAAELLVGGLLLHPLAVTMRHEPIDVTSWDDHYRHYIRGQISYDVDLTMEEARSLDGLIGKEVILSLKAPHDGTPFQVGRAALSNHGYSQNVWPERRFYATFVALD